MQTWFEAGAADGFMLDCPVLPTGMTEFINEVVPILVERGRSLSTENGSLSFTSDSETPASVRSARASLLLRILSS